MNTYSYIHEFDGVSRPGPTTGQRAGTFLSNIGLAVTEFAGKQKVFFLAAEPLTDKITWQDGNRRGARSRSPPPREGRVSESGAADGEGAAAR